MRRLRHVLFDAATLLSLVLCVTTAVLWVRSHAGAGDVWERSGPRSISLALLRGRFIADIRSCTFVSFRQQNEQVDTSFAADGWHHAPATDQYGWVPEASSPLGFYGRSNESRDMTVRPGEDHIERRRLVAAPLWCPLAVLAILPVTRLILGRSLSRSRLRSRLCPACGYDIRATPDRCPECGTIVAKA